MKSEFYLVTEINWNFENQTKNMHEKSHYIFLIKPDFSIFDMNFQYLSFVLI